jgi:hypothetical protein
MLRECKYGMLTSVYRVRVCTRTEVAGEGTTRRYILKVNYWDPQAGRGLNGDEAKLVSVLN